MYIKKLELLNFQVIEKFEAEFTGNVYFVTGDNELGKSTLLKAIGALLTGERDDVLRNGASNGFAKMIVGDDGEEFDVSLSFTENNPRGTLTIKQKSTGMATNNVSMLQRIFGYQDFDAVEFSRWSETAEGRRKQIAVVKSLLAPAVRERIEAIDVEVSGLKTERTGVNRDVKTFDTMIAQITDRMEPGDIEKYARPIDVTGLMEQQSTNAKLIEKAKTVRAALAQRTEQLAAIPGEIDAENNRYQSELATIDRRVADAKAAYEQEVGYVERADKNKNFSAKDYEQKRKRFGLIVFQSKRNLEPLNVYLAYLGRWEIEVFFDHYKNIVDRDEVNVHTDYRTYATELINFLTVIITMRVKKKLKKTGLSKNYSQKQIFRYLSKYKKVRSNANGKWESATMLKYISEICSVLGI